MPKEPKARAKRFLKVGKIAGAHGLAGAVNVYSYTHPPARLVEYRPWFIGADPETAVAYEVVRARLLAKRIVAELADLRGRAAAEALKGQWIFVDRAQVPKEEGEYLWDELVGCTVRTTEGETLGEVVRVVDFGAQDILLVQGRNREGRRGEWMIPFTEDVIQEVRPFEEVVVAMLEGLDACFTPS